MNAKFRYAALGLVLATAAAATAQEAVDSRPPPQIGVVTGIFADSQTIGMGEMVRSYSPGVVVHTVSGTAAAGIGPLKLGSIITFTETEDRIIDEIWMHRTVEDAENGE